MVAKTQDKNNEEMEAVPTEAGTDAHCRRVAAWCEELARKMHLPANESAALVEAAMLHHRPIWLRGTSLSRLMGELGVQTEPEEEPRPASPLAERVLPRQPITHAPPAAVRRAA